MHFLRDSGVSAVLNPHVLSIHSGFARGAFLLSRKNHYF